MVDFTTKDLYLIGEIGINHNGDIQIAKRLIDAVHACGWNCAKFQKRNPDVCVPEHQKSVIKDTPWGQMTYLDYKHKIEFSQKQYGLIDQYCKSKPIDWTASVWDLDSLEFLMEYEPPFIKIASALVTNIELLTEVCKTNIPIMFSTGMCELSEVDTAVDLISKHTDNFALMHTNSSYPTPVEELNLQLIPFYKNRYKCTVGYSGHEYDMEPTVIACYLGANIIERHITLSHDMWGTDQKASLEIKAMDMLYGRLKDVPLMMGSCNKTVTPSEINIRKKLRG
tara:strand:+ start:4361 stop:5206 length:846 start_codon:yes stop_codon:yes gene_type:complete